MIFGVINYLPWTSSNCHKKFCLLSLLRKYQISDSAFLSWDTEPWKLKTSYFAKKIGIAQFYEILESLLKTLKNIMLSAQSFQIKNSWSICWFIGYSINTQVRNSATVNHRNMSNLLSTITSLHCKKSQWHSFTSVFDTSLSILCVDQTVACSTQVLLFNIFPDSPKLVAFYFW